MYCVGIGVCVYGPRLWCLQWFVFFLSFVFFLVCVIFGVEVCGAQSGVRWIKWSSLNRDEVGLIMYWRESVYRIVALLGCTTGVPYAYYFWGGDTRKLLLDEVKLLLVEDSNF